MRLHRTTTLLIAVLALVDHDAEGLRRFGPEQRNLGTIRPHHDRDAAWRFRALEEGCYVIQVTVEAIHVDTGTVVEATGSTNIAADACEEG